MFDLSKVVAEATVDEQLIAKAFHEDMDQQKAHLAQLGVFIYVPFAFAWWVFSRRGGTERMYIALLCYSWVAMSLGMHALNKTLVMWLDTPCFITVVQMAMAAIAMALFNGEKVRKNIQQNRHQALQWLIVPVVFSGMLMSSIFTFKYMSLSVMTVVRNLAPLVALPVEIAIMAPQNRPAISAGVLGAMGVMLAGAVIYGFAAPVMSGIGLVFAVLNMSLAITDRMLQRKLLAQDCQDLRLEACTFINNFVGIFPSLAVALATHESSTLAPHHAAAWFRADAMIFLFMSGLLGIGMCYFGLAVQRSISATSFLVLNNMSKFAVVAIGVTLFADPFKSDFTKAGLLLSLGGSCWYGFSQIWGSSLSASKSSEGAEKKEQQPFAPSKEKVEDPEASSSGP